MSTQEIIEHLPKLLAQEREQVKASLAELEKQPEAKKRPVWEVLLEFAGKAEGLPPDLAENHDRYL